MEVYSSELFSDTQIYVGLFREVENAPELKEKIKEMDCCLLNPKLVVSIEHVLLAVTRALQSAANSTSKTNSLFLDVVYYLSGSSNIRQTLQKFGICNESNSVVMVCFKLEAFNNALGVIKGTLANFKNIVEERDLGKITHEFKLKNCEVALPNGEELAVLSRIAIKDL